MAVNRLNFITGNQGKLDEVRSYFGDLVDIQSQAVELDEIQGTIEEIAEDKCRRASLAIGGAALTEDTALEFHALKGLPGPYIKQFLTALGLEGLNNLLAAYEDKTAEAVTTLALTTGPGEKILLFQGRTLGKIVPARGENHFAGLSWDAVFEHDGQTYAEMGKDAKAQISHRSKALKKLKLWLIKNQA
ncbi:MAG: hypothetical protein Q9227_006685 [Pyrenula ochraceoflavens]